MATATFPAPRVEDAGPERHTPGPSRGCNLLKGEAEAVLDWLEVRGWPARLRLTEAGWFAVEDAIRCE
jgi:hypothetical protein